ncbi:MAG: TraM recognition domain-containing protein, partial [Cyanobacteria bacterium J06607_17]
KFMFNPQSAESADMFSRRLGDEESRSKSKSRNTGSGKSSITRADQERTRRLFAPEQFNRLPQGHCIYINPAYGSRKEGSVPQKLKIKVTPREIKAQTLSIQCWNKLRDDLISRGIGNTPQDPDAVTIREREFQAKLPIIRSNDTTMPTGNALTTSHSSTPQTISRRI